jgi:hypothetical protein
MKKQVKSAWLSLCVIFLASLACTISTSPKQVDIPTQVIPVAQVILVTQIIPVTQIVLVTEIVPTPASVPFEVDAGSAWQETGIILDANNTLRITLVSALYKDQTTLLEDGFGSGYVCGRADCCEPMPDESRSALIGRVGDEKFLIGNGGNFVLKSGGMLALRINDCDAGLYDNSGTLKVQITP